MDFYHSIEFMDFYSSIECMDLSHSIETMVFYQSIESMTLYHSFEFMAVYPSIEFMDSLSLDRVYYVLSIRTQTGCWWEPFPGMSPPWVWVKFIVLKCMCCLCAMWCLFIMCRCECMCQLIVSLSFILKVHVFQFCFVVCSPLCVLRQLTVLYAFCVHWWWWFVQWSNLSIEYMYMYPMDRLVEAVHVQEVWPELQRY